MNIEDENYKEEVLEWINKLDNFNGEIEKDGLLFPINFPPFENLTVELTSVEDKRAILFHFNYCSKIYFPQEVRIALSITPYRCMQSIKVDNKFWAYDEIMPKLRTISFGMDMTMPFLEVQNWEKVL